MIATDGLLLQAILGGEPPANSAEAAATRLSAFIRDEFDPNSESSWAALSEHWRAVHGARLRLSGAVAHYTNGSANPAWLAEMRAMETEGACLPQHLELEPERGHEIVMPERARRAIA